MGNFETLVYSNGKWDRYVEEDAWDRDRQTHPYISFAIHDSDFAVVDYRPAIIGSGRFYLRLQPRDYFEDPKANPWVDVEAEASGLATWAHSALGRSISPDDVREFVAPEKVDEPEDVFVEETMERLLKQLGLGMPDVM